ncbi:MAG: PepSY domain-containing protein [candidate division NC10 bacterium]|nr:PepSY domain-containing protein [candidate division NC10 bacterium]
MKKVLGVALVAVLVLGVSGAALARWGGPGMGMGMGFGSQARFAGWGPGTGIGPGAGFGPGAAPCWNQGATGVTATAIDEAKAKEIATEYVTKNLPGYTVEKLVKFERPRGTMYQVEVKGPKDEVRYLHINPFGNVIPFGAGRAL